MAAGGHSSSQLVQRTVPTIQSLFRTGIVAGMQLWSESSGQPPLVGDSLRHATSCVLLLQTTMQAFGLPATSVHLVSTNGRSTCLGAFSAKARNAIFVAIPEY